LSSEEKLLRDFELKVEAKKGREGGTARLPCLTDIVVGIEGRRAGGVLAVWDDAGLWL